MAESLLAVAMRPVEAEKAVERGPSVMATPRAEQEDYSDHLSRLVRYFEEAENVGREARERSERCRDYYNNNQLTAEEIAVLKRRGQPPIYVNYIMRKVDTLCGIERRSRTDPKAYPRNPEDEKTSEAATDSLRYVADENKFNAVRSQVYNEILVEGYGGADIVAEEMPNGDISVLVKHIPWDRIVYDPHSRKLDFSDAKYKGIVLWMDAEDAKAAYPDYEDAIEDTLSTSSMTQTYEDRPKYGIWCDSRRKRVRIVQMHYEAEGEWFVATYTKCGFLVPPQVSPYVDKYGRSTSSLKLRSAYVDRENNRFGHVEGLIPLQDEINKRRSKSLHLLSQRQTYGRKSALLDTKKAKVELARPDGHVELTDGARFGEDFGIIPNGDMANGQIELMQQALAEMNATGANAAMQGKDDRAQSGVALQTKIQAGAVEMEPLADGLRDWTKDCFEAMWLRIRQFWTEEKWIRVTDDDRNIRFVGLNKQVTLGDRIAQMGPEMGPMFMQQNGFVPGDPRLQQVVDVENNVSGLDVDIVIEEGPDLATLQSEQFQTMADLAKNGMPIPPKAIIQASSLPSDKKKQILDEMEKGPQIPPEVQKQLEEMGQQVQQLTQRNQLLEVQNANKQGEQALRARELDIQETEAAAKLAGDQQPAEAPQPVLTEKDVAEADYKRAQTEKTLAEADKVRLETLALAMPAAPTEGEQPEPGEGAEVAPDPIAGLGEKLDALIAAHAAQAMHHAAPVSIERDPITNKAVAVRKGDVLRPIARDDQGRVTGLE